MSIDRYPRIVQTSYRGPMPMSDEHKDYARKRAKEEIGLALVEELLKVPGGLLVSQVHMDERTETGFFGDQRMWVLSSWANVVNLPDPETYLLLGGPYDGRSLKTHGSPTLYLPAPVSLEDLTSMADRPNHTSLEKLITYVRQTGTNVYYFDR